MRQFFVAAAVLFASPVTAVAQSPEAGEKVFSQCRACHQVGETAKNLVGPQLNGLFARKSGSAEGYSFTEANKNANITWDDASFREYIIDPKAKIPGTKMAYAGLKNSQQVSDLTAFLKQFDTSGKKTP